MKGKQLQKHKCEPPNETCYIFCHYNQSRRKDAVPPNLTALASHNHVRIGVSHGAIAIEKHLGSLIGLLQWLMSKPLGPPRLELVNPNYIDLPWLAPSK